jgi:hypothetical protein
MTIADIDQERESEPLDDANDSMSQYWDIHAQLNELGQLENL